MEEEKYFINVKNTVIEGYFQEDTVYAVKTSAGYSTEELPKDEFTAAREGNHNKFENGVTSFVSKHGFSSEEIEKDFRENRNFVLEKTDRLLLEDYPISVSERVEILAYRQQLRDASVSSSMPVKPSFL